MKSLTARFGTLTLTVEEKLSFRRFTGLDPHAALALAVRNLPEIRAAEITARNNEAMPCFRIKVAGEGFGDDYTIDCAAQAVGPGKITNTRNDRLTGRRMFANRAVLGLVAGMDRMLLYAGDEMGGYVWARTGAALQEEDRAELSANLNWRLTALKPHLGADAFAALKTRCGLYRPEDLRAIADDKTPLPPLRDAFNAFMTEFDDKYDTYVARGFFQSGLDVGKFMLCAQFYRAHIDLRDSAALTVLECYTRTPIRRQAEAAFTP